MAFELNPGQGSLFKNDRKEQPNQPDYKGKLKDPSGKLWDIAGWRKEGKNGKPAWMSLSLSEPWQGGGAQVAPPTPDDDDSIPF